MAADILFRFGRSLAEAEPEKITANSLTLVGTPKKS